MNQLWSLRGHFNSITNIQTFRNDQVITADENGWIIIWNLLNHRPRGCWKGHDNSIISMKVLPQDYLFTHSKDGEVRFWLINDFELEKVSKDLPDVSFNTINMLQTKEFQTLLTKYPQPSFDSIPVNNLNYCNIDFNVATNLLVTPATLDANNFDIYRVNYEKEFNLSRLVQNFDPWPLVKKLTLAQEFGTDPNGAEDIEEVNETKRDGLGIMMKIKFITTDVFFVGYESGHILGFRLQDPQYSSTNTSTKYSKDRLIINKDMKVTLIYVNEFHTPNPILTMEYFNSTLMVGATLKVLSVHNIDKYVNGDLSPAVDSNINTFNLKYAGIQSIQFHDNKYIIGFWNGMIKTFDLTFNQVHRFHLKLPNLAPLESNEANTQKNIESNVKLSVLKSINVSSENQPQRSKYKLMVIRKKLKGSLLMAGYNDGKLLAFELTQ